MQFAKKEVTAKEVTAKEVTAKECCKNGSFLCRTFPCPVSDRNVGNPQLDSWACLHPCGHQIRVFPCF